MARPTPPRVGVLVVLLALAPARADEAEGDLKVLRDNKVGTDEAGLHAFFRKRTPTPKDLETIDGLVRQLGERSYARRQKASDALAEWGPAAFDALREAVKSQDLEIVRRAERCLEEIEKAGTDLPLAAVRQVVRLKMSDGVRVLLGYAPSADDEVVTEAVLAALRSLSEGREPDAALREALRDRRAARRAAAAWVLGRHPSKSARESAAKALADPDPNVRFRAAYALLEGKEKSAVPALMELVRDAPTALRWQAEELLNRLPTCVKGDAAPTPCAADDTPEGRKRSRDEWLAWWEKHGLETDLAKYEGRAPFQNVTLVPEMHAHKVWEFGPDGKIRWEIATDLRGPIDAQVLPNGRVLIAELDGGRVTERDRAGKIYWQHAVSTPIYCRRMPGGNTFISTNHACFVVTPAGKEVFRYQPEQAFFIHSIHQMPTGHIAAISMEGDVREIGPNGQVVRTVPLAERGSWSGIEGLPGNRYLCVGSGRVREIDATGKVVWKLDYPGACFATRLPSGNTLVVDNAKGLAEVNREGKVLWQRGMGTSLWRAHRR